MSRILNRINPAITLMIIIGVVIVTLSMMKVIPRQWMYWYFLFACLRGICFTVLLWKAGHLAKGLKPRLTVKKLWIEYLPISIAVMSSLFLVREAV